MTTYDDVYTEFMTITKTDPINIPTDQDKIYDAIHNAVHMFNNRMRDNLQYDDSTELFDRELNHDELVILANFLKLIFLENQLTYFTTLFQPFAKDVGLRNYQSQIKSLEFLIQQQNKRIDELINNTQVDFM